MSSGIVVCSVCNREVHQDGLRAWRHCEDRTALCSDGSGIYPASTEAIVGRWCGRDGGVFDGRESKQPQRKRVGAPMLRPFPKRMFASFKNRSLSKKAEA